MPRKTKRAPVRRALPAAVMEAVDQITPALAQRLKATMARPVFTANEMLDMVIPDKSVRHLLSEAANYASNQCPRVPAFEYQLNITQHYGLRIVTELRLDDANLTFMPDKVYLASPVDNEKVAQLEEYCRNMYEADRSLAQVNALVHYLNAVCPTTASLRTIWPDFPSIFAGYEKAITNRDDEPWLLDWGHKFKAMQPGMPPPVFDECIATIEEARRAIAIAQLAEPETQPESPEVQLLIMRAQNLPLEPVPWANTVDMGSVARDGPAFLEYKL